MGAGGGGCAPEWKALARTGGMSSPNQHLPEGLDYMFFRKLKPEPELQRGDMFIILQAVDLPWKEVGVLPGAQGPNQPPCP